MNSEEDDRTVIRPKGAPRTGHDGPAPGSGLEPTPDATPDAPTGSPLKVQPVPTTFAATGAMPPPGVPAPERHAITLPAGTRLAEFEITSTIGEGGFGIVYLAWDHSLERKVAVKEYMPSSIAFRASAFGIKPRSERHQETFDAGMKSFINEAKLLAQFDHPSLLKVYRFWEANGTAYMVMPFLQGATLRDTVRGLAAPPDEAWLLSLLNPMCDALAMLHAAQVYHRDIAPDNILLMAETGRPLLLDFGAARRVIGDMTQALTAILKPGYAPVEQYADMPGLKQGPWTDVYALAAVMHWMILGKTPAPSVGRLFDDAYVPLAQTAKGRYSEPFLRAIDRALAVMPDKRTQTVEAFRADLHGTVSFAEPLAQQVSFAGVPATLLPNERTALPAAAPATRDERTRQATAAATRTHEPAPDATRTHDRSQGSTVVPSRRKALPLAIGAVIVVAASIATALLWPKSKPAVPVPAVVETMAPSVAASAPVVAPVATPAAQTPPVVTPSAQQSPQAPPAAAATSPTPVVVAPALEPEVKPATGKPARPKPEPRVEPKEPRPRVSEPKTTEPRAAAEPKQDNRDECAKLFQRLSIGDTDQSLIDRIRTLRCR